MKKKRNSEELGILMEILLDFAGDPYHGRSMLASPRSFVFCLIISRSSFAPGVCTASLASSETGSVLLLGVPDGNDWFKSV